MLGPVLVPARLNPFAKLPNPKPVWAWGMYDLANQSFQLLINSLLFALFVERVVFPNPEAGRSGWSMMVAASMIVVIALSPVLGALADRRAWKRELLLASGVVCSLFTMSLALLQPGWVWAAFALYLIASVACGLGENFLGSFLPEISTPRNIGFVSALGWTMSYIGALLLLGLTGIFAFALGRETPDQMRPMFVLAGLWFALGMIPAMVFLRERADAAPPAQARPAGLFASLADAARRLADSARQTRRYTHLARFLGVFFVYSMGTKIMIFFLGIIGGRLGFRLRELVLVALVMTVTAGLAAATAARVQDRLGHRRTIRVFLSLWAGAALAMAVLHLPAVQALSPPALLVWVIAGAMGLGLGGIGTASRAMVGLFTPPSRAAEFFGVWGMVDKLALIVGVLAFGAMRMDVGLFLVAAFFLAGLALMGLVDEHAGARAAHEDPPASAAA